LIREGFIRQCPGAFFDQAFREGNFFVAEKLGRRPDKLSLAPQALAMLTDGVDLRGAKLRPWYERES